MIKKKRAVGLLLLIIGTVVRVTSADALADKVLLDFDQASMASSWVVDSGSAQVVIREGRQVLQLRAAAGEAAKIRLRPASGFWDLRDYVNVTVDMENPGKEAVWFRLLIADPHTKNELPDRPNLSYNGWVKAKEKRAFNSAVVRHRYRSDVPEWLQLFPDMNGVPHAEMWVWFGVNPAKITEVVLTVDAQPIEQSLWLHGLRGTRRSLPKKLLEDPDAFFPMIDVYGQYKHEEWPGKIYSDQDLVEARRDESRDFKRHPRPIAFNRFGGWKEGPVLEATGHFRTEKRAGKWWLVDPEGKLFWSLGCTGIGQQRSRVKLDKKRHFFEDLPVPTHPLYSKWYRRGGQDYDAGNVVLFRKFGKEYASVYNEWSLRRARSWGLNTLGSWSAAAKEQPTSLKMPYTIMSWIEGLPVKPIEKLSDPFDPRFVERIVMSLRKRESDALEDPYCIGIFDQNEIYWGKDPVEKVLEIREQCDLSTPIRQALEGFLSDADSEDNETLRDFFCYMTDTYYRKCQEAVRLAAPNKLYLGSRIHEGAMIPEVVRAAARYCDVVSFNVYEKELKRFGEASKWKESFFTEDKPFLVGEFHFGALDRGKFAMGLNVAADQRNRAENYVHYIKSALTNPRCVGAHWFHYMDSPTTGRHQDAENFNCGILSTSDTPYPEMVEAMRRVGASLYSYRERMD